MKTKKHRLFLWISLAFFALSLMIFLVEIVVLYYQFKTTSSTLSPNDLIRFEYDFVIELFAYIIFGIPALLVEPSCIRSVYRILKYKPRGISNICYLISAIISFSAFAYMSMLLLGIIPLSIKAQEITLVLLGFPVFIVSFALGSIPIKHNY